MRKLNLLLISLLVSLTMGAKKVTEQEALQNAQHFMQGRRPTVSKKLSLSQSKTRRASQTDAPAYYVFNVEDDGGFVIISGDDRMHKVLGYSDKGRIDFQNLPPQLEGMLEQYSLAVQSLSDDMPQHVSWTRRAGQGAEVVLNTPTWNQWYPFNVKAPEFDNGNGEKQRAPIGCVATATAIVMKYKGFPTKAIKDFEYTWYSSGTPHTVNYSELNIDYSKLRDDYENLTEPLTTEEENAIGDLMYAVAGLVNMQFGLGGSEARLYFYPAAMREVFGISKDCQYIARSCFSDEGWRDLIEEQINNDSPVIYEAYNGGGHVFVCDGYNSEGYYHINWGWGGFENGFFMLDDMNGYNQYQCMVINFTQDSPYDSSKYSRAWLSDGTKGGIYTGVGKAAGIQVTTNDIETGVPFNLRAAQLFQPVDFDGVASVALVDANDNIVEFVKDNNENEVSVGINPQDNDGLYSWIGSSLSFSDVHFTSPIQDEYKLALYTKETGEEDWKPLLGTIDAPSTIPVKGNVLDRPEINLTLHGDASKVTFERMITENLMYGDLWEVICKVDHGVAAYYINGRLYDNINDFNAGYWGEFATEKTCDVDIYYYPYSELLEKEYNVEVPGSLSSLIDKDDMMKIWKLRLTGELNHEDLYFLLDLPCLMHLDLEDSHIVENEQGRENFIPEMVGNGYFMDKINTWGLETCKLPKDLKGFEWYSFYARNIESITIPASVDTYGEYALSRPDISLNFIEVQNPVPVDLPKGAIGKDFEDIERYNVPLFVPMGSKSAYESHPSWQGFQEIIETSEPLIGEFVDDDEVRYLILNDCAAVSGVYGGVDMAEIKSVVEYNGKTYPVKYAVKNKLNAPSCLVINNDEAIDFKLNQAQRIISPNFKSEVYLFDGQSLYSWSIKCNIRIWCISDVDL